ncbi:MAG TPA: 50S ribosomal protein L29 [Bacteroidales bacterium]|nr:50S ribosomal protein L29 [Bacteroidales bacterium]
MKVSEIREFTDKEIIERIELEKSNLLKLWLNHSISPLDNPMKIKETRRNIARLKTILHQRKLSQTK